MLLLCRKGHVELIPLELSYTIKCNSIVLFSGIFLFCIINRLCLKDIPGSTYFVHPRKTFLIENTIPTPEFNHNSSLKTEGKYKTDVAIDSGHKFDINCKLVSQI